MVYRIVITFLRLYYALFFKLEIIGFDNVPKEGAAIICSNHISNFDPPTIAVPIKRLPSFIAKKQLFKSKFFNWVFTNLDAIPVDRDKPDMSSFRTVLDRLKNNHLVVVFAQGHRVKESEFDAKAAKAGVALFAVKSGADVIPTAIISDYKRFGKVKLVFGEPISFADYKGKKVDTETLNEISTSLMEKVNSLIEENS